MFIVGLPFSYHFVGIRTEKKNLFPLWFNWCLCIHFENSELFNRKNDDSPWFGACAHQFVVQRMENFSTNTGNNKRWTLSLVLNVSASIGSASLCLMCCYNFFFIEWHDYSKNIEMNDRFLCARWSIYP